MTPAKTSPAKPTGPKARKRKAPNKRETLANRVLKGERRALARAITLIESTRPDHRAQAEELLETLLPHTGGAIRIGLSGSPGVGKSTFTDSLGSHLIELGKKVAVLAVDPTSRQTGGSILGDKTRMTRLAQNKNAFIRPTPAGLTLGGVARRTREAVLLVEAAGFDVALVETVGVGQSEVAVADMVDMFVLLIAPGGGDELQGIKRGIMELADLVVVNKADGDMEKAARRAAGEYGSALHLMRPKSPHWTAKVCLASALKDEGIEEVWASVEKFREAMDAPGALQATRAGQATAWMWSEVEEALRTAFENDEAVRQALAEIEAKVAAGAMTPAAAARKLLAFFRKE